MTKRKLKKLFLAQSYLDSWDEYQRSLRKSSYITWDYVILTASNEEQALAYEQQILDRLTLGLLPEKTVYKVLPDPDGKRVGSGWRCKGESFPGQADLGDPFRRRQ